MSAALALVLTTALAPQSFAQGSLSLGNVIVADPPYRICPGPPWYSYTDLSSGTVYPMSCRPASVQNCQNGVGQYAPDINFTFAYLNPVGITGVTKAKGVVVYLTGGNGTHPSDGATGPPASEHEYIDYYFKQGYVIVQVAWASPWETIWDSTPPQAANIQNAACRPATFLNYVYNYIYLNQVYNSSTNPTAGMCAQGFSAGSAAIAYSLAYYGAGNYLDNVELMAGPVLSDIKRGCIEPKSQRSAVSICAGGVNEPWCKLGTGGSWSFDPGYKGSAATGVQSWTNKSTCASGDTDTTSDTDNAAWLAQSIVDQSTGAIPTFTYPHTAIAGWLCRPPLASGSQNNSSPQGELFYAQVGPNQSPPTPFAVYAVDLCDGAEGVTSYGTNVPGAPHASGSTIDAIHAIENDMIGNLSLSVPVQCVRRH